MPGVPFVSRARNDQNVRPHFADMLDDFVDDARGDGW